MSMPVTRFFCYVYAMDKIDASEQGQRIEAASMPYMDKRDKKKVMGSLRRRLGRGARQGPSAGVLTNEFIGGLPADVARLKMLERESPLLRGLVEIRHKKPEGTSETAETT